MTTQSKPFRIVDVLIGRFGDWLSYRRMQRTVNEMDSSVFEQIAGDLHVSPTALEKLLRRGPRAADQLLKLLTVLGIDQNALLSAQRPLQRDMVRVCALYADKGQRDRDLAAGTSSQHYREYCLNASTIDALGQPATAD